ncbi:MAG: hypothetical protein JSR33_12265, partial [Proteobacteria bacterium]|nr:hypothetical protein [Pseudomonadota bacterium]
QTKILVINLMCILFFISFAQLNGSIVLLINHYATNEIKGIKVPSQWLLTLQPIIIILFFLLGKSWSFISNYLANCSSFKKLCTALLFLAIAFFVLAAFSYFNESGKVSLFGLVLFYLFVSLSEFIFIPTCYNYLAQVIPYNMVGIGFGYFFISRSLGNYLAMIFSKTIFELSVTSAELKRYVYLFVILAGITVISVLILFLIKISPGLQISKLANLVQKRTYQ